MASTCAEQHKFDPGAAPYGNFINYYQFNSVSERVARIPNNLLNVSDTSNSSSIGLDIGCNTGNLTISLFEHLKEATRCENQTKLHILGIDLDENLIQRAVDQNPHPHNLQFLKLDIMNSDESAIQLKKYLENFKKERFDFIFCFSVTMWIHLNHGDFGLQTFLQNVSELTDCLVLEPQPWKCYKSASRRMRTLKQLKFQDIRSLTMRETVVEDIKKLLQMCSMNQIQECGETKWKRPILIFKKI